MGGAGPGALRARGAGPIGSVSGIVPTRRGATQTLEIEMEPDEPTDAELLVETIEDLNWTIRELGDKLRRPSFGWAEAVLLCILLVLIKHWEVRGWLWPW